jgi:hypothetical protein
MKRIRKTPDEILDEMTRILEPLRWLVCFSAELLFVLLLLSLNMCLLYLLHFCAHIPPLPLLVIIPAAVLFSCWIWWREKSWFLHHAERLWDEMSKDLINLLVGKED